MPLRVDTLSSLKMVGEIIALHDEVWDHSTGIIGLLRSSTRCFVLLDDEERVAGYAFVEEDRARGFAELQDIAISPGRRQQGYGHALMAAVTEAYPRVKLVARARETALIAFYEKLGFRAEFAIENYYDIGVDGLRMSRTPASAEADAGTPATGISLP